MPEKIVLDENKIRILKAPAITAEAIVLPVSSTVLVKPSDQEIEKARNKGKKEPQAKVDRVLSLLYAVPPVDSWKSYENNVELLEKEAVMVENADRIDLPFVERFMPRGVAGFLAAEPGGKNPFLPENMQSLPEKEILQKVRDEDPFSRTLRDAYFLLEKAFTSLFEFPSTEDKVTVCVWAAATYFYQAFDTFPYLFLNAPKQSGKTRLLQMLERSCFYAHPVISDISASSLFRMLDNDGGVLLVDEIEGLLKNEEMRTTLSSILNSGYKKGAMATRSVKNGEDYQPRFFDVYGPKALANISGVGDVLQDRCIRVKLMRSKNPAVTRKSLNSVDWLEVRMSLLSGAVDVVDRVAFNAENIVIEPEWDERDEGGDVDPIKLASARETELWLPLFAVAKEIGEDVFMDLKYAFRRAVKERLESGGGLRDDQVTVLQAFYEVGVKDPDYRNKLESVIPSKVVSEKIRDEYGDEDGYYTTRRVSAILRGMGFKRGKSGYGGKIRGYWFSKEEVEEFARRYDVALEE